MADKKNNIVKEVGEGVIDGTKESLNWFEKALKIVSHYNVWEILKGMILILIASATLMFMTNPTWIFDLYDDMRGQQHKELLEQRMKISPEVQNICENLMYDLRADRVMFLELHNGNIGSGGLPFTKASAVYETIRDVYPVAEQYQNTNLSLVPFSNYLYEHKYWHGSVDELLEIDRSLGYRMKSNLTEYFEASVVDGVEKPLGFIFVSYSEKPEGYNPKCTVEKLKDASHHIALLIEIDNK